MEVFTVEFWEFWDDDETGGKDSLTVSAKSAEEAIKKAKKLAFAEHRAVWVDDSEKPTITHKLNSIEIHQVIHKETLDG